MKIALAQIKPFAGNVNANIAKHLQFITTAAAYGIDAIFFPELSLTGYEPKMAKSLAKSKNDLQFDVFQEISDTKSVSIGLGFPKKQSQGIEISMLIIQPGTKRQTYSKQYLHSDESPYFKCGREQILINIEEKKIAPAICFEALQPVHIENSIKQGAEVYLASVAKSAKGISIATTYFSEISKKHQIPVLMVNCIGYFDNFLSAGTTSVWSEEGILMATLNESTESLLIVDLQTNESIKHEIVRLE